MSPQPDPWRDQAVRVIETVIKRVGTADRQALAAAISAASAIWATVLITDCESEFSNSVFSTDLGWLPGRAHFDVEHP